MKESTEMSHVTYHVSRVMRQMSHVTYHVSHVFVFLDKELELVGVGSVINGA